MTTFYNKPDASPALEALYERLEPVVGSFCPALARQPLHINRYAT